MMMKYNEGSVARCMHLEIMPQNDSGGWYYGGVPGDVVHLMAAHLVLTLAILA